jgi:hypothetical protein
MVMHLAKDNATIAAGDLRVTPVVIYQLILEQFM